MAGGDGVRDTTSGRETAVPITAKDPSGLLVPAASRLPGGTDKPLLSRRRLPSWQGANNVEGSFSAFGTVPITAKDPFRLLAQPASPLPGGTDKPLLSRRRLPSWYGANNGEGSFGTFGTVPITAKDPDRILTRVRRRVALWLPKGVGTFGRRAPLTGGNDVGASQAFWCSTARAFRVCS